MAWVADYNMTTATYANSYGWDSVVLYNGQNVVQQSYQFVQPGPVRRETLFEPDLSQAHPLAA